LTITKFIVKLNRTGKRSAEYVQRIDQTPLRTTADRKSALMMGKFAAEDVAKSLESARCKAELVSVSVDLFTP
jgi:hypothetical protein